MSREEGNDLFRRGEYARAIEVYTRVIEQEESGDTLLHVVHSNRSAAYLQLGDHESACEDAKKCIEMDATYAKGYSRLGKCYYHMAKYVQAVEVYKKGLLLSPGNIALEEGLALARVRVLNELFEEGDEGDQKAEQLAQEHENQKLESSVGAPINHMARKPFVSSFLAPSLSDHTFSRLGDLSQRITPQLISRLVVLQTLRQLLQVPNTKPAFGALIIGLLCLFITHLIKILVIVTVIYGLYRYKKLDMISAHFQEHVIRYMDRVKSILTLPLIIYCIPIVMGIYGQAKFFLFVHEHTQLTWIMLLVTLSLSLYSFRHPEKDRQHRWGRGKRLKLVAHIIVVVYWILICQHTEDFLPLLGPAMINTSAILFTTIPSKKVHHAIRCGLSTTLEDVLADVSSEITTQDTWLLLGLSNWLVQYWQQPTDFTFQDVLCMLSDSWSSLQSNWTQKLSPEIERFRSQWAEADEKGHGKIVGEKDDYSIMVQYLRSVVDDMPPSRAWAFVVAVLQRCPSCILFVFLLLLRGRFVISLAPFLLSEWEELKRVYNLFTSSEFVDLDSIQLILYDSALLKVWSNLNAFVYCLECSLTLQNVTATACRVVSITSKLTHLYSTAQSIRERGVLASSDNIIQGIIDVASSIGDSRVITGALNELSQNKTVHAAWRQISAWWWTKDQNVYLAEEETQSKARETCTQ